MKKARELLRVLFLPSEDLIQLSKLDKGRTEPKTASNLAEKEKITHDPHLNGT